jgi:hypothetical protein|tara:strand:+ start:1912 stop:2148 length:237 start_codon:yes stop_codon:yes gene_type:complete
MAKIKYQDDTPNESEKQIDIQGICVKHGIGRHDLIHLSTTVARLGNLRPVEALERLLECDDVEKLITTLKFNSLDNDL